ncbi:hypothetical protein LG314_01525 [Agrococcus terreus]|uniref:hypothetical protein n=1 Tax=Agrococcus terreus TaxID=574649 RepID=UPI003851147F
MAQVVRPQGIIGPIVLLVIGVILLLNGVPNLFQWLGWTAQTAVVWGVDTALETALVPLLFAGGASFIGLLMVRGGWGALRRALRGTGQRAGDRLRSSLGQARNEAEERYAATQEQLRQATQRAQDARTSGQSAVQSAAAAAPQSWRERIEAVARETEAARRQEWAPQQPQQGRAQQGYGQQPGQQLPWQLGGQQAPAPQQVANPAPQQWRPPAQQQLQNPAQPGADRLARIEQLRGQVEQRARRAADDPRRAAAQAATTAQRAARAMPQPHLDAEVEALVGRLDLADSERIRPRGSSLSSSSLTTHSLSRTSLSLNSLLQRRR